MAITTVGESQSFSYSGGVQTFTVPYDGLYKLEVWGAQGGTKYSGIGGKGGHSGGYKILEKDTVLYICCGGAGGANTNSATYAGYNGGGSGSNSSWGTWVTGGGGATHIALVDGTLASIGFGSFVTSKNGLIVAGGGGGVYYHDQYENYGIAQGGSGGGLNGGKSVNSVGGETANGGSQTGGGGFGQAVHGTGYHGGAGGGFYSGYTAQGAGGGGGSGYIDNVPTIVYKGNAYEPITENGINNGNGRALITYVAEVSSITAYIGDIEVSSAYVGDVEVDAIL